MLTVDPAIRITVDEALEHRWFKNCSSKPVVKVPKKLVQKLRKQRASSMLTREALKIIVKHLPSDAIEELNVRSRQHFFNYLDPQSTGFITSAGLREALSRSGYNFAVDEIEDIIKKHDFMGKGRIKYSDFLLATLDRRNMLDEENLWIAFRYFDTENTGKLNLATIQASLIMKGCEVSDEDIQSIREEFGISADDTVSFEDFSRIMIVMNSLSPAISDIASPLENFSAPSRKMSTDMRSHVISIRRTDLISRTSSYKPTIISPPDQETSGEIVEIPPPRQIEMNIVVKAPVDP